MTLASADVYFITASSDEKCAGTCMTLYEFATNTSNYVNSTSTHAMLVFLPATHYLTVDLIITNIEHFSMYSNNSTAIIVCASSTNMHFSHSQSIHINDLEFVGCGGNQVQSVGQLSIKEVVFNGEGESRTSWELVKTKATIINSMFKSNKKGAMKTFTAVDYFAADVRRLVTDYVGGAIISARSQINISQTLFENNGASYGGVIFAEECSIVNISKSVFTNNFATNQGGILYSTNSTVTIEMSTFDSSSALHCGGILSSFLSSNILISTSRIHNCSTTYGHGGVLYSHESMITMKGNRCGNNSAGFAGGLTYAYRSNISIEASDFTYSNAYYGGTLYSMASRFTIKSSNFSNNAAISTGGVLYSLHYSVISIEASVFHGNSAATRGGALYSLPFNTVVIAGSVFINNSVAYDGGALYCSSSNVSIHASKFSKNAASVGGALAAIGVSYIKIQASDFYDNSAVSYGGVMFSYKRVLVKIETSILDSNTAKIDGGVLYLSSSMNGIIAASKFSHNAATSKGGVLYSKQSFTTIIGGEVSNKIDPNCNYSSFSATSGCSRFITNNSTLGAVFYAENSVITCSQKASLLVANNLAKRYAVIFLGDSLFSVDFSGAMLFFNNSGSVVGFNSHIVSLGSLHFIGNHQPKQPEQFSQGGGITLLQSNGVFSGSCSFQDNHSNNGGAVHSSESKVFVNGNLTIANNRASRNGGGIYLLNSELNCQMNSYLTFHANHAASKGGGIHAIGSSIKAISASSNEYPYDYSGTRLNFSLNKAEKGGGLSLEANAKFYILKYTVHRYSIRV